MSKASCDLKIYFTVIAAVDSSALYQQRHYIYVLIYLRAQPLDTHKTSLRSTICELQGVSTWLAALQTCTGLWSSVIFGRKSATGPSGDYWIIGWEKCGMSCFFVFCFLCFSHNQIPIFCFFPAQTWWYPAVLIWVISKFLNQYLIIPL